MGWRLADEAFVRQVRAAGASCEVLTREIGASGHLRRTMALTDVVEGIAARRAARGSGACAIVYSSVTAALLQPRRAPAAVRFDGIAAVNRPGVGGAWQRRRERTVLAQMTLLLPWSDGAAAAATEALGSSAPPMVLLPPPVSVASAPVSNAPTAVAYAANPDKRALDMLCEAWRRARPPGATLAIGGIGRDDGLRWLAKLGGSEPPGVRWLGVLAPEEWLATVAGARVFVNDRLVGSTPLAIPGLPAGPATVRIEMDGYRTWTTTVQAGAGEQRVAASLERK